MTVQLVGEWQPELAGVVRRVTDAAVADQQLALPDGIVNLKLVDDDQITALNTQYTGNAYATDVLTFPYQDSPSHGSHDDDSDDVSDDPTLADVVISLDTAQRQADQAATPLADEVALLALHGLLHAAGYDHLDAADQERMERAQRRIMTQSNLTYRDFLWHQ